MALPTVAINKSKIKFRFAEPYTSEASNFQAGINDIGVYRGGTVAVYGASPSKSIRILTDGTSTVALHRNGDGYGTVINETAQPILDLTSDVTWPIPSGGLQLYIYFEVVYAADAETTGLWGIAELGDLPDGAVRIAMLDLPEGATEILSSYIRTDGNSYRAKILGKKGIIVPKMADIGTGSSRARFQITDRVSCLGKSPSDTNDNRSVMLLMANYPSYPLTDGTSSDTLVYARDWYAASSGGSALTLSDMDADGCYTNPYIDFGGVSTFDSAFKVAYYAYTTLDSIDTTSTAHGFVYPHANQVKSSLITGTSDTVAAGYLSAQLLSLLNKTSGKIDALNPNLSSSDWTLLWRSNDKATDVSVDDGTLSIYYTLNGMMIVKGGYISGTDFVASANLTASTMWAHSIVDNMRTFRYATGTGPLTKGLSTTSDWSFYHSDNTYEERIYNYGRNIYLDQSCKVEMNGIPHDGTNAKYLEVLRMSESELRIYYSAANNGSGIFISSGCYWSDADDLWKRVTTASENALQLYLGRDGLSFKNKDKDDADFATGWEDNDSDWTHVWKFGDSSYPYLMTSGESIEKYVVPFQVTLNSGHVSAMQTHTYTGPTLVSSMNFRSYRNHVISSGDFSYAKNGSGATLTSLVASDIGYWGAKISGKINLLSYMTSMAATPIDTDSFSVPGNGYAWRPGQIVALRGSTGTGVYVIKDWSESTDTTINIDTANGEVLLGTISLGTSIYMYTVFSDDENTVIEAFYEAQLF